MNVNNAGYAVEQTRSLRGCTLRVKNPLSAEERARIEARLKELEERLAWNEARRRIWNEATVFGIKLDGLNARTQQQRCDHFRYELRKAWAHEAES